ncbi:type I polyketide synthase [Devosia ginsengisoli]|uniref:Type I polyketide synthase n=2 Tax=Devosia ginsengisoli TaxID=400770 RepID=A0A5B8LW70_9HYPH|nr:type I polyketide synthase [Devosia ginsengisoli]
MSTGRCNRVASALENRRRGLLPKSHQCSAGIWSSFRLNCPRPPECPHGVPELSFDPAREGKESMGTSIALMGMACRFPDGANTPDSFWRQLLDGRSAIGEIPADRFSIAAHVDANTEAPGKSYTRWGGFIDDVAGFDPAMFEISPREAQAMDPQQRLLLMVAYEAMEDAGLTRNLLGTVRTGVYVGASSSDYASLQRLQRTHSDIYAGTGSALSIVANRVSHRFNLSGPSLSIDTACSSSLVALDQAVTALNSGRIDIAIVAGVNLLIDPATFVAFSKAGMLSPTGTLSAFDRRANGYVRGEGIGAIVLMRETDALAQGRRTRALIRATAVNQDGRTPTLTAPDLHAQQAMMAALCNTADIAPHDVDYVEAHGTGTPIGDPIEAAAIGHVFGGAGRQAPLLFGSVKPNIGHLESAAGIASLIKAVLVLENRLVPASINSEEPNPAIAFEAHNMAVPQAPAALGSNSGSPVFIAVNSFGFGGTNAGVLLQSANSVRPASESPQPIEKTVAVPLSAASAEALRQVAGRLHAEVVEGRLSERSLADIAASLGTMREGLPHRAAVIAASRQELANSLSEMAERDVPPPVRGALPAIVSGSPPPRSRLAFTFAGQGGQWWGMGRRLLLEDPTFSRAFMEFDQGFEALSGWSVHAELLRDEAQYRLDQSRYAMPAIFGVQIGLGALWQSCDVRPDFVLGHSFGELAAAYLAGAISLETATRMIHVRCQIREKLGTDGAMLAVGLAPAEVQALLGPDSQIDIAALNAASMVTLAGPPAEMAQLSAQLAEAHPSAQVRPVQSDTAWHSRQLAPLEDWFRGEIGDIEWQAPQVGFISTVTGQPESRLDADYWWQNLRQPVRYRDAVLMALDLGANAFLELSPHRVLSGLNATNAAERAVPVSVVNSLVRNEDDFRAVAVATAQLHCSGRTIDWQAATGGNAQAKGLPTYPWQLSPYWRHSEEARDLLHDSAEFPLLGKRSPGPDPVWSNEVSLGAFPFLRDHAVGGDVVFPAAGFIEIMLCAGRNIFGDVPIEIENFEISAALFIGADERVLFSTRFDAARHLIDVRTRTRDGAPEWILRASARLRPTDVMPGLPFPLDAQAGSPLSADDFYAQTASAGFGYGPAFRTVASASVTAETASGAIVAPDQVSLEGSLAHPCLLDGALQLTIAMLAASRTAPGEPENPSAAAQTLYLPTALRRLRFAAP